MAFERTHPRITPGVNRPPPELPHLIGYRLFEAEARALHASAHVDGCWCTDLRGEDFLREIYSRCLQPAGFDARIDEDPGILIEDGPGISEERPTEMYDAIRSCE